MWVSDFKLYEETLHIALNILYNLRRKSKETCHAGHVMSVADHVDNFSKRMVKGIPMFNTTTTSQVSSCGEAPEVQYIPHYAI